MSKSYQTTAVIFLDIMGTKDRTTFDEKYAVHQIFHEEVKNNEARKATTPHVIHTRILRSFSDCAFILYTYKEGIQNNRKDDLNLMYIALYNTSLSIIRIVNSGFLVRGGACLGDAFIDSLGFFGPTIEDAYDLESSKTKAIYPRIILSEELGRRLYDWERSKEMDETASLLFTSIPRLILKDEDGWYYLNIFYQLEMSGSLHFGTIEYTLDATIEAVGAVILRTEQKHHGNTCIMRKMNWMRKFTANATLKTKSGISPIRTFVVGE
ncbi:MAG: hypothetical protein WCS52_19340 [bacterium]